VTTDLKQYRIGGTGARDLAAGIESAVADGRLPPGKALPSVRSIAAELDLSPTTVAAALERLRDRGVVVTRDRSGSNVSWRPPLAGARASAPLPREARDVARGNPDPALLPDLRRFLRSLDPPGTLYGEAPVLPELREAAGCELGDAGIPADHLSVVSGALDGVERVLEAWLRPGDLVAVEDPGYHGVIDLCRALGLALRPAAVDDEGMRPEELEQALAEGAAAVVITPRAQNPAGAAVSERRARELRGLVDRADVLLIEDDHLGPVAGVPRRTAISGRGRWAAARSVSKTLGPDLRLAVLAADADTIDRVQGRQLLGPQWVSHLTQRLVAALWTDERVADRLERAAEVYAERRERFMDCLAAEGIGARGASGLNVWVPVPDEAPVVGELLERGWAVTAGAPFRLRAGPAVRVTTSTLGAADARRLAGDMAAALQPARRTRAA
jgi:DNA-binding transcriptional MocR family regulator